MLISSLVKATNTYLMCHLIKKDQNKKIERTRVIELYRWCESAGDVQSDTRFGFFHSSPFRLVIFRHDNIQNLTWLSACVSAQPQLIFTLSIGQCIVFTLMMIIIIIMMKFWRHSSFIVCIFVYLNIHLNYAQHT